MLPDSDKTIKDQNRKYQKFTSSRSWLGSVAKNCQPSINPSLAKCVVQGNLEQVDVSHKHDRTSFNTEI